MINMDYLMIQNNLVTNCVVWDGNLETWTPPDDALMLPQETTPAMVWVLVDGDYELQSQIGQAQIGFAWNGTECVTNEPKPTQPTQPITTGTQEL